LSAFSVLAAIAVVAPLFAGAPTRDAIAEAHEAETVETPLPELL
jgi:hypothetical protein